jgi:hypothetical protein
MASKNESGFFLSNLGAQNESSFGCLQFMFGLKPPNSNLFFLVEVGALIRKCRLKTQGSITRHPYRLFTSLELVDLIFLN